MRDFHKPVRAKHNTNNFKCTVLLCDCNIYCRCLLIFSFLPGKNKEPGNVLSCSSYERTNLASRGVRVAHNCISRLPHCFHKNYLWAYAHCCVRSPDCVYLAALTGTAVKIARRRITAALIPNLHRDLTEIHKGKMQQSSCKCIRHNNSRKLTWLLWLLLCVLCFYLGYNLRKDGCFVCV